MVQKDGILFLKIKMTGNSVQSMQNILECHRTLVSLSAEFIFHLSCSMTLKNFKWHFLSGLLQVKEETKVVVRNSDLWKTLMKPLPTSQRSPSVLTECIILEAEVHLGSNECRT